MPPGTDGDTAAAYANIAALKKEGNAAFKAKHWNTAVDKYTDALRVSYESSCEDHVHALLSNRIAALLGDSRRDEIQLKNALADSTRLCKMARNWSKSFYRMGQVLEAQHKLLSRQDPPPEPMQHPPWLEAYKKAWRRSAGPDRAIEAALNRCGVDSADVKIELSGDTDLLEDMLDLDDTRLKKVYGTTDDLPVMPAATDPTGTAVPGTSTRSQQKALMGMMITEMGDFETKGDYRKMRENAICALQMAVMLGEAVPTCYLFTQLSAAHLALREYRKAEAYAHTAIEVAENGCSMHKLMSMNDPLAKPAVGDEKDLQGPDVPGLAHPRSSYPLKTQCHMSSQAYLSLGNVLSATLKMPKAVQAYRLAERALTRMRAPAGSEARKILSNMQASLQVNIGNQYKKENLPIQALQAYEAANALAQEACDPDLQLQVTVAMNRTRVELSKLESGVQDAEASANEQDALLAMWNAPATEWRSKCRIAHVRKRSTIPAN